MFLMIQGDPRTKKNSMRVIRTNKRRMVVPSKAYEDYEKLFVVQCKLLGVDSLSINDKVNVQCEYYMKTHRKVDLTNLLSATMDCLVSAGVLEDDNSEIVVSHDGSRVFYDKENPRVEITIEKESQE